MECKIRQDIFALNHAAIVPLVMEVTMRRAAVVHASAVMVITE